MVCEQNKYKHTPILTLHSPADDQRLRQPDSVHVTMSLQAKWNIFAEKHLDSLQLA
jgi:hypothetical protein